MHSFKSTFAACLFPSTLRRGIDSRRMEDTINSMKRDACKELEDSPVSTLSDAMILHFMYTPPALSPVATARGRATPRSFSSSARRWTRKPFSARCRK